MSEEREELLKALENVDPLDEESIRDILSMLDELEE